jgi:hypothetical protein
MASQEINGLSHAIGIEKICFLCSFGRQVAVGKLEWDDRIPQAGNPPGSRSREVVAVTLAVKVHIPKIFLPVCQGRTVKILIRNIPLPQVVDRGRRTAFRTALFGDILDRLDTKIEDIL